MRKFGHRVLLGVAIIFLGAVLEMMWVESIPFVDALFSAFTIFVTGDPGSLRFDHISPFTKVYASLLMTTGAVALASIFGFVADFLLSTRIDQLLGRKPEQMNNHVIVCGTGQVGFRICEELTHFGDDVTVISDRENEFVTKLRNDSIAVLVGDLHSHDILEKANIQEAKSVIVATDDDLLNVELALNAKELRPDINIVLKMFDQRMARKLQEAFGIRAAFSATALAAPAFAAASHCDSVIDSLHLEDGLLLTANIEVLPKTPLAKSNFTKLRKDLDFTVIRYSQKGREPRLHPTGLSNFSAGDSFTVVCELPVLERIQEMNQPAA